MFEEMSWIAAGYGNREKEKKSLEKIILLQCTAISSHAWDSVNIFYNSVINP